MARSIPPADARSRVVFDLHSPALAVVSLIGDHDLTTSDVLDQALARAAAARRRHVLVDLSACTFIDSTVIEALLRARARVEAQNGQFGLIISDPTTPPARAIALIRLYEVMPIFASLEALDLSVTAATAT
jgi:anti-sigma B factor antagonist